MTGRRVTAILRDTSFREVTVGEIVYRLEAIGPKDLMRSTSEFMQHIQVDKEQAMGLVAEDAQERDAATQQLMAKFLNDLTPDQLARKGKVMEAMVAASVRALRHEDSETWDTVQLHVDRSKEEANIEELSEVDWERAEKGDRPPINLFIGRIPKGHIEELFGEVWALSTDDGRAAERLQNFRRGREDDVAGGPNRQEARKVGA